MMIEIVVLLVEMFVKCQPILAADVVPVGVKSQICWGFRFPHILIIPAFEAVPQVDAVPAPAVQFVPNFERFSSLVALKSLCFRHLPTALVLY